MDTLHQVKLYNITDKQKRQMAKGRATQIKANQLKVGTPILVSLDKANYKRYRRAFNSNGKSGFRIIMTSEMITGSGFSDILKGIKSGVSKVASVAVPYVKNLAKSLLPKVRSDIDANLNSGVDWVANKVRTNLSPIIGDDIANELVNQGTASVKGFAADKLNQIQSSLQGMGLKKGVKYHYQIKGGKLSLNFAKIAEVLKPIAKTVAKIAVPALANSVGGPALAVPASVVADSLLGTGAPPRLYLGRPSALPHEKAQLKGKGLQPMVIAIPKKAPRGRKKKINGAALGAALMPMGKGRGGALFPM